MKILYSIFIYILFSNFILSNSNKISIKKEIKTKKINFKKNSFNIKTKLRQLTEEEENEIEEEEENEEEDENSNNFIIEFEENLINEEFEEKNENEEEDLDLIKEYKNNEYEEDDFIEEENEKRNDKEEEEDNEEEINKNEEYDEHIIEEDEEENENKNKENEENEYEEKEEENEFELEENDNEYKEKEIEENEYEYEEEEEEKKENEENEYEEKENDEKIDEEKEEEENEYEKKEEEEEKEIEIEENDKEYEEIEIEENESEEKEKEIEIEENEYEEKENDEKIDEEKEEEENEYEKKEEEEEKEYEEKEEEENEYENDEVYYYQINTKLPICQSQDNINLIFENINSKDILDGTFQLNLNSSSEMGISIIDCINENNNQKIYCNLTREKEDIEYNILNFTYDKINITNLNTSINHIKFIKQIDFAEKQETIQKIDDSKFNFNIILISEVNSPPLFVLKKNGENILGNPNCVINNNKIIQCSYEDLELLKNNNGDYEVYYINPCNEIKMNITVQITTQNTHRKFGSSQFIKSLFFNLLFISFFLV